MTFPSRVASRTAKNVVVVSNAKKVLQSFEDMTAVDFDKAAALLK